MKINPCPTRSRSVHGIAAALLLLFTALAAAAQNEDKRVEAIRELYKTAKENITHAEQGDEGSKYFINELILNRGNASFPAVGTYRSVQRFYYTYGDRSRNPYPDRLRMVIVETQRAGVVENEEYLFNDTGELVFYFNRIGEGEQRLYFADSRMIRRLDGQTSVNVTTRESQETAKIVRETAVKLLTVFRSSL